jgi:trigger factor
MDFIKDFKIAAEPNSQVKIEGEIPFEELQKHREKAVKAFGKNMEVDGFRKGHVPEKVIVERVGEMTLLAEMAERAIGVVYPEIIKANNVEAIGHPQISITKIAPNNPLGFTAMVAVLPKIELPDYKKIAADINKNKASAEVTDAEVDQQVADILRQKIAYERIQQKAAAAREKGETAEVETHTHADGTVHEGPAHDDEKDIELPELTDDYVKTLGQPGQFESVADFKAKVKEHLAIEKEREVIAAHRAKITDAIIEKTEMVLPQVLIDSEIDQMFAQMNEDLTRANLKMDDYLGHIKKTKDDLKKEWTPAAEKRAKLQLVLNEIAKKDSITPDQAQLDSQVDQLLEQYKDADETRVRIYVASVMTNEAVMQSLEK